MCHLKAEAEGRRPQKKRTRTDDVDGGTCLIVLFIYYMVYTHVKSFTIVKNRK